MNRLSPITSKILGKLPPWFAMKRNTNSSGAQLLNVVGLEIEEILGTIQQDVNNTNLATASTEQIDYLWQAVISEPISQQSTVTVRSNGITFRAAETLYDLTAPLDNPLYGEHKYMLADQIIYTLHNYSPLTITVSHGTATNSENVVLSEHHVWNVFDEYGLLYDLPRISGEKNLEYKNRLLGVFRNPANTSFSGMINGISRELDVPRQSIAIHSLHDHSDTVFQNELYAVDNKPKSMLKYYVELIQSRVPIMWGQFKWNEGFWDVLNRSNSGSGTIPAYYDASISSWENYTR